MIRRLNRIGDVGATKLALIFGFNLTIWIFFIIPLAATWFPAYVQARVFYYASGWVQLFALPLMVYVSNKIEATGAKQDAYQAELLEKLDHTTSENQQLAQQVAQLMTELRDLLAGNGPGENENPNPPPGAD